MDPEEVPRRYPASGRRSGDPAIAELRFPRRLGEKCLEELDDVDAPAFRAFPLPFLVLLEGEDCLEAVVAFPAFVRIGGHGITSLPARPGRLAGFYIRKDYNMNRKP